MGEGFIETPFTFSRFNCLTPPVDAIIVKILHKLGESEEGKAGTFPPA